MGVGTGAAEGMQRSFRRFRIFCGRLGRYVCLWARSGLVRRGVEGWAFRFVRASDQSPLEVAFVREGSGLIFGAARAISSGVKGARTISSLCAALKAAAAHCHTLTLILNLPERCGRAPSVARMSATVLWCLCVYNRIQRSVGALWKHRQSRINLSVSSTISHYR